MSFLRTDSRNVAIHIASDLLERQKIILHNTIQTMTQLNLPLRCARQVSSHFLWPVSGQVQNCLNHVPENKMSCMRN